MARRRSRPIPRGPWPSLPLSGADRTGLRRRANPLDPAVSLGKTGLSDGVKTQILRAFGQSPLVKVRLVKEEGEDRREAAARVATAVEAELIGVLGRVAVLYRPPADDRDDG